MLSRYRLRRIFKWAGSFASLLILGLWLWSTIPNALGLPCVNHRIGGIDFALFYGGLSYSTYSTPLSAPPPATLQRISVSRFGSTWWSRIQYNLLHPWPRTDQGAWPPFVVIPLSLPFLVISALTGCLWCLDRRRNPPGHCQCCGYNLTGAAHERCTECGHSIPASTNQHQ